MSRCVIITAYQAYSIREAVSIEEDDLVVCADGGYLYAKKEGIVPHAVIGDFDSGCDQSVFQGEVLCVPSEKDETDTYLCLEYGMKRGCDEYVIVGGIGGRLDHTLANIQLLSYGCDNNMFIRLIDKNNMAFMIENGEITLPCVSGYKLSVFAYAATCTGVTLENVKYPLEDAVLTSSFPLGISNEFSDKPARICCKKGRLLIMLSRDEYENN